MTKIHGTHLFLGKSLEIQNVKQNGQVGQNDQTMFELIADTVQRKEFYRHWLAVLSILDPVRLAQQAQSNKLVFNGFC